MSDNYNKAPYQRNNRKKINSAKHSKYILLCFDEMIIYVL